jgi:transcriptional regulator with XRE-family HTH domain
MSARSHDQRLVQFADLHVATRVRARRIALGLTQPQLAELIGVTYQQAHRYENGTNRLSASRLHALAQALGVEVRYFFEGLGAGEIAAPTLTPTPQRWQRLQQQLLELLQEFVKLSHQQQVALCGLARGLADAGENRGPEPQRTKQDTA